MYSGGGCGGGSGDAVAIMAVNVTVAVVVVVQGKGVIKVMMIVFLVGCGRRGRRWWKSRFTTELNNNTVNSSYLSYGQFEGKQCDSDI